ncbi:hypothetical protein H4582DRAFT_2058751 [Lactarius indigo]|nr:hypothetical protein H4582DRAFT_2058751 [Lactarius indigo]
MQGNESEIQKHVSELEENNFKEAMRSEFWKGVSFLSETDSDAGRHQREMTGPSNGGFSEVPKNVVLLQPVIQKLIDKDPPKGVSAEWLSKARSNAGFLKKWKVIRKEKLEDLLSDLENEMVLVDVLAGGMENCS